MRAGWFLVALVGCTPDIASGSYLCGPERVCPEGQSCDGSDGTCVLTNTELPFACDPMREHEPDNTPGQAAVATFPSCVSAPFLDAGCLAAGDDKDWVKFKIPSGCIAVQVEARLSFPIAWEPVSIELWDLGSMTMVATDMACKGAALPGAAAVCLTSTVTVDGTYGLKIKPKGGSDCGGTCNYNRYELSAQLSTPG